MRMGKAYPSSHISGEPGGGTEGNDLSSYVAAVDDLERKIINNRYQQIKTYTAISDAINELENEEEIRIMRLRYLRCERWDEIAIRMQTYEIRQIYRMHGHALSKIKTEGV